MTDGWADLVLHVLFTYCLWMKREFMQVDVMHTLTSRTNQTDFHKCFEIYYVPDLERVET